MNTYGTEVKLLAITWNFREICHIIKLRTSNQALPEMREVAGKIRDIMVEKASNVFGDLSMIAGVNRLENQEHTAQPSG